MNKLDPVPLTNLPPRQWKPGEFARFIKARGKAHEEWRQRLVFAVRARTGQQFCVDSEDS